MNTRQNKKYILRQKGPKMATQARAGHSLGGLSLYFAKCISRLVSYVDYVDNTWIAIAAEVLVQSKNLLRL